jgi:hypothetical protein
MSKERSQGKESAPAHDPEALDEPFIRPISEAIGGVTPLQTLVSRHPVDLLVREIVAGRLPVYDTGNCLFAQEGRLGILRDMRRPPVAEVA